MEVLIHKAGGAPARLTLTINPPQSTSLNALRVYTCQVEISSMTTRLSPIIGETPLEALKNAVGFLEIYLNGIAAGGRIEWL